MLRTCVGARQDDWDLLLSQCEFALNNSKHSGVEFSPFEVIFGFPASLPLDHAFKSLQDNKV